VKCKETNNVSLVLLENVTSDAPVVINAKTKFLNVALNGAVHLKKKTTKKLLLIIYSAPCHSRYPCHSFFSRKEIKVFDENIPGFSPHPPETPKKKLFLI